MTSSTSTQPGVSVIVPVYNMERYIAETIESVLQSSYSNIEIVLVDDESTDNSAAICAGIAEKDERVRFFRQKNSGAAAARNHAIREASGKYILPVDADDLISNDYIEKAVEAFEANPEIKVVASNAVFFGEKEGSWELPDFDIQLLARKNLIHNSSMFRKSDWEKAGGYCEDLRGREDWDFWISMLKDGAKLHKLSMVGLHYRIRKNSKRVRARKWKREIIDKLNERHPEFFRKHLGGPLRYFREMSRFINLFCKS